MHVPVISLLDVLTCIYTTTGRRRHVDTRIQATRQLHSNAHARCPYARHAKHRHQVSARELAGYAAKRQDARLQDAFHASRPRRDSRRLQAAVKVNHVTPEDYKQQ
jgi:hypothetical protein